VAKLIFPKMFKVPHVLGQEHVETSWKTENTKMSKVLDVLAQERQNFLEN